MNIDELGVDGLRPVNCNGLSHVQSRKLTPTVTLPLERGGDTVTKPSPF
jgi:hypothetical protein